jgi:hypothetical protein
MIILFHEMRGRSPVAWQPARRAEEAIRRRSFDMVD